MIHYTCRNCRASLKSDAECVECASDDIAVESRYEHTVESDAEAARRLANVAHWNRIYAGMDFFAVARDLSASTVDTATTPVLRLTVRQAS